LHGGTGGKAATRVLNLPAGTTYGGTQEARRAPLPQTGCQRHLADADAGLTAMPPRMRHLATLERADACTTTRLYFMELLKARSVTPVCTSGPERARMLGRFDADVAERINNAIAANCR
jgi:hypothetical protein